MIALSFNSRAHCLSNTNACKGENIYYCKFFVEIFAHPWARGLALVPACLLKPGFTTHRLCDFWEVLEPLRSLISSYSGDNLNNYFITRSMVF